MSLIQGVNNPAIDNLVQSSLKSEYESRLEWISYEKIADIKPTRISTVHYASRYSVKIILVFLGSSEECTPTLVNEFARIYSLPAHKYNNDNNFRRYSKWLESRNKLIIGFTKSNDKYYMVADKRFYHCYSRYGFCSTSM